MAHSPAAERGADGITLLLLGDWRLSPLPSLKDLLPTTGEAPVIDARELEGWDSRLVAQLLVLERESNGPVELHSDIPELGRLLALARSVPRHELAPETSKPWYSSDQLRQSLEQIGDGFIDSLEFLGATLRASVRSVAGRGSMRRRELIQSCYQAGPDALGIITLTSILVGMILAYLGAAQLQQFGAAVYVADLVAVGMLREMGALMTAVVMAGRTGAAYAAQLSTMQGNEEIDAIRTLGINPMEFLVVPRLLALLAMMPLLVVFSDALGILGGALVAGGMGVTPLQYLSQLQSAVSVEHFIIGIAKAIAFALLIAIAGCRAGMNAGRNSAAVGKATTDAVVTAVVYLIVADAAINILCQQLGY